MADSFNKNLSIDFFNQARPVTFAHKKGKVKPTDFSLHLNDCVEVYIYVSGDTDYVVGNDRITLTYGDVITISPYEIHTPVFKNESEYERFYVLFPLDTFSNQSINPLKLFSEKTEKQSAKIQLTDDEKEKVLKILYKLSELSENEKNEAAKLHSSGLLLEFAGIITKAAQKISDADILNASSVINPLVKEILTYISINPEGIESVGDVAKHFYISPPYLSALFKKHVGINVSKYIQIKKVALAKKMLDNGESVTETCYKCGFSDCSYFIKIFKQYVGITPLKYKGTGI